MTPLSKGTEVDPGDILAPDAIKGAPIVVEELVGELPHGHRYRARQDNAAVLLTVLDPAMMSDPGASAALARDLQIAASVQHRSLLPIHGAGRTDDGFIVVETDPGGTTVREFAKHRAARGRSLDTESIYTLVAHVCNGLEALHPRIVHAYVTADTVIVAPTGRVFLTSCGIGPWLPLAPGFVRFQRAGRLPNVAPEQLIVPPQLGAGTDVFGAATLFLELVTGLPLQGAGEPIQALGLQGPSELVLCLERATAPNPGARPPDMQTFKAELAEALRAGAPELVDPLAGVAHAGVHPGLHAPGLGPGSAMPPHPGAAPPNAAAWGGPVRGRPTPFLAAPYFEQTPPPAPLPYLAPNADGPDRHPTPLEVELAELDRATRLMSERAAVADAEEMTASVAAAIDPAAAHVHEPLPPPGTNASSSLLRLSLPDVEDAAARLSTIDGEHATEVRAASPGPAGAGYFGSMYEAVPNRPEVKAHVPEMSAAAVADADQRPEYWLIQRGQRIGPLSLYELGQRAREGTLNRDDLLRHRSTGEESTAGSHDALRKPFREGLERQKKAAFGRGTPVGGVPFAAPRAQPRLPVPAPMLAPSRSPIVMIVIAIAVVAVLGTIGWFVVGG